MHVSYFKPHTKKKLLIENVKFKTIFMNNSPLQMVQVNDVVGSHVRCEFHYGNECVARSPSRPYAFHCSRTHCRCIIAKSNTHTHTHTNIIHNCIFLFLSFTTSHYDKSTRAAMRSRHFPRCALLQKKTFILKPIILLTRQSSLMIYYYKKLLQNIILQYHAHF